MKKRIRVLALVTVAAMAVLGAPAASKASPYSFTPRITFPEHAGGYQLTSFDIVGRGVPTTTVRLVLGDPPCDPGGCSLNPTLGAPVAVDPLGDWTVPVTLPEGSHRVYMFWNDGLSERLVHSVDFYLDVTVPAAPTIDFPLGAETFTSNVVPITGTAEPRAHVVIVDEQGNVRSTTASDAGEWSYAAIFRAGSHTISAYQDDLAFNQSGMSASVTFDVDVDEIAPAAPTIDSPLQDDLLPAQVTVSGTAEPLSSVEVFEHEPPGFKIYGSVTAAADGTWSMPITFLDGLHFLRARATDVAGNRGPESSVRRIQVDAIAPVVKTRKPDLYTIVTWNLLDGDTMRGTATDAVGVAGVAVRYYDLTGSLIQDNAALCPCPGQNIKWEDTPVGLAPGLYFVEATATDLVGNQSNIATINLLVLP